MDWCCFHFIHTQVEVKSSVDIGWKRHGYVDLFINLGYPGLCGLYPHPITQLRANLFVDKDWIKCGDKHDLIQLRLLSNLDKPWTGRIGYITGRYSLVSTGLRVD